MRINELLLDDRCDDQNDIQRDNAPGIASWDENLIAQRARQVFARMDQTSGTGEINKRIMRKTARKSIHRDLNDATDAKHPAALTTPHRQQFQKLGIVPDGPDSKNVLASTSLSANHIATQTKVLRSVFVLVGSFLHANSLFVMLALPGEVALKLLQRAGEDMARFCHNFAEQGTEGP